MKVTDRGVIKVVAALGALVIALVPAVHGDGLAVGASSDIAADTWAMYQRTPDHNAVLRRPGFAATWTYQASGRINSGLAVVGDRVVFATFSGKIIALNLATGSVAWEASTDNIVMSTPVIVNNLVYVGTGHNGGMTNHRSSFVYTAPLGQVQPDMWGRPEGDHVLALDLATGKNVWTYRTAGEDMPSPTVIDGVLVFANGDFHAYGLRASDGTALWQQELGGLSTMASAMPSAGVVLVGVCSGPQYRGSTVALEPRTGRIRWRSPYGDCDSTPTVADGRIFTSGVDGNDTPFGHGARAVVAAIDPRNGKAIWFFKSQYPGPYTKIGSNERAIAGTYADGVFYQPIPTADEVVAFDARRGRVNWRFRTMGPAKMSPVIENGRLYIGDTVGLFYTVDTHSGKLLKVRMFDEPFSTSPPVIVGDSIIVAGNTKVLAFSK